jgi:hypothetical protein
MRYMIDEPNIFDSLESWELFLDQLLKMDTGNSDVSNAIIRARDTIEVKAADNG